MTSFTARERWRAIPVMCVYVRDMRHTRFWAHPVLMGRLSPTGRALVGISVAVGLLGLLLPDLHAYYNKLVGKSTDASSTRVACPLGYTSGPLPEGHVHVPGHQSRPTGTRNPSRDNGGGAWFINATIWTADPQFPWASSMEVDAQGGITKLVPLEDTAPSPLPGQTVTDLGGAFLMPGFVDAHVHFVPAGLALHAADLRGVGSRAEFERRVRAAAAVLAPGQWLLGGGWDDNLWGGGLPESSWLDEAAGDHPAWVTRMDGHLGLANKRAMEVAGIGPHTQAPEGGVLDRDASGAATGIFREEAASLIKQLIPEPSTAVRKAAVFAAASHALSRGVTTVVDLGRAPFADEDATWRDLEEVYDPLAAAGELPIRVYAFVPLTTWGRLATRISARGRVHPSGRLFWGGVKAFADGSLGSRTALMWEAYMAEDTSLANAPGAPDGGDPATADGAASAAGHGAKTPAHVSATHGAPVPPEYGTRAMDLDQLARLYTAAAGAGLQVAVHAIGDRAVDEVLGVMAGAGGAPALQHRVEHAQHMSGPATAAAFAAAGVMAVPNPLHLLTDAPMLSRLLGGARAGAGHAFAYATLAAAGARLAFASDWPVVDIDPLGSYYIAAFRRMPGVAGPAGQLLAPDEQLEPELALRAHTAGAAASAMGLQQWVGMLQPGKRADFVVLDRSPLDLRGGSGNDSGAGVEQLPVVLQTYLDGRCVHGCDAPPSS